MVLQALNTGTSNNRISPPTGKNRQAFQKERVGLEAEHEALVATREIEK